MINFMTFFLILRFFNQIITLISFSSIPVYVIYRYIYCITSNLRPTFPYFSKLKIRACLKFPDGLLLFIRRKYKNHHYIRSTKSRPTEKAINITDSECICLQNLSTCTRKIFESKQTDIEARNTYRKSNLPIFLKIPL